MTHFVIVSDYNGIYEISSAKGLLQEFAGLFICFCVMQQQMIQACFSRVYLKPLGGRGVTVAKWQIRRSLVRSQLVSLEFFIDIKSFRSHCDPGVDSASNRNEYQEHFLGVKAAGA